MLLQKRIHDKKWKKHTDLITNSARKGLHKKLTCNNVTAGPQKRFDRSSSKAKTAYSVDPKGRAYAWYRI
jgi:hypothetical protein